MKEKHDTRTELISTSRRNVLRGAGAVGAFSVFGVPAFAGTVRASSHAIETLYLTDSGGDNGGNFLTKLYQVDLDSGTSRANLTLLEELTDPNFDQVDAIAASLDGTTVYMVDKNSKHLGVYDVSGDSFTDAGAIAGLPGGVVLAAFSPTGELMVASQNDNTLYTVDLSGPTATSFVTVTGANVQGADIAFDADEDLFLYSSGSQELFTVDYDDSSPTFGQATRVGPTGDFFTGLAVRNAGNGDLVGSNTTRDEIVVVDKATGAQGTAFEMYLDNVRYAYGFGDMTVGALDVETCEDCMLDENVKYEFACTETDPVTGECIVWDFVPEDGVDDGITYVPGSFNSKDGGMSEPMTVDFATEYCELYVLVKSGQELEVQSFEGIDGGITVETANDEKYAISFVQFFCTHDAANEALEAFPSKGKGKGA
jgi:hypothetical protein